MDALLQRLGLLARVETLALRVRAQRIGRSVAISAAALVAAMFAFGLVNLAAFNALAAAYGGSVAALILAAADGLIALVLAMRARTRAPTAEEAMVDELRALTIAELGRDAERVKSQLLRLQHRVTQISDGIARVGSDPLRIGLASVGPILSLASRLLNRKKDHDKDQDAD